MKNRLYVGNLAYATSTERLRARFEEVGHVAEARVVTERGTGRARGYAIVVMGSPDEAAYAIQRLDGTMLDGNAISVRHVDPHGDE